MTKIMVAVLSLVLGTLASNAQTVFNLTDSVRFNPEVRKGMLQSGIPYYLLHNEKPAQRIELVLVVNAGAVLEDDDQNGLAHFCEHMAFNGTQGFPKSELVSFLEGMGVRFGADLNAYTNKDETVYTLTIPLDKTENLIKGIQVLRDWAGFVSYEEKAINDERGVIMEEWRLRKGAEDRVNDKHRSAMYYGSKYAMRDVIGDTNVLLRAPTENLRRFYRTWYRPENISIVAVGDIDVISLEQILNKYFSSPPSAGERTSHRPRITIPSHKETFISIASDPELQGARAEVFIKHPADTVFTYQDYKHNIVKQMAFGMLSQRLNELSRKNPPAMAFAFVGEFPLAREYRATYGVVGAADKNVLKSLNALLTEFARVKQHGYTSTELARSKESTLSNMEKYYNERDKSESKQFADELTRHVLQHETVPGIIKEWEIHQGLVPTITLDDVNQMAANLITKENRVITISVPEGNGFVKPTEAQVSDLLEAVDAKKIDAYVDISPTKPLMETAPEAGKITGLRTMADVGATELTLSNGARVVYKKTDFKNDEILFAAQSWGGQSLAPEEDHFTNMVAADVVDNGGVASFDVNQLTKLLNGKNVGISPRITMEQEVISGSSSPKDLRTFMELLYLGFTQPRKDAEAFASWKQKMKADRANKEKSPEGTFFDTLLSVATNNHPRSRSMSSMSEADVDNVDLDKAFEFYKARFKYGSDFTFYFVGNFDEEALKQYSEIYIASLPSAPMKETWKDVGIRTRKGQYSKTVFKGVEPKSIVVLSTSGPCKYGPAARYDVTAMCEVMGIVLREQMREEKGGVYFVSVQPNFEKIPESEYSVSVIFGCAPDRVQELISTVKEEISSLRSKLVSDTVVAKVREIQTKEREISLKTNRLWLQVMSQFDKDEEPYSNVFLRDEYIKALTPAKIMSSADQYLSDKNFAEFVLKPEASATQQPAPAAKKKSKKK